MLRCHPAKLTRSSLIAHTYNLQTLPTHLANKSRNNNPFYHQSLYQSQPRTSFKEASFTTMSGSALDSLKDLMSMIDEFEVSVNNKAQPKQSISKKEQSQKPLNLQTQADDTKIPAFLIQSHIPIDAAFRPDLPHGHTPYSWTYSNIYNAPQTSTTSKTKAKAKTQKQAIKAKKTKASKGNKRKIIPKKMMKAGDSDDSKQSFDRRDHLRCIEKDVQLQWDKAKVFESNPVKDQPKYMCTFPYPYMNGYLHLGHAFTITKAEFRAGYERLKGKNVLFPFAFHCTGMPIAAAAKRIKSEIKTFGDPPTFPQHEDKAKDELQHKQTSQHSHAHSKLQSKKSKKKYQWEIMKEFDLKDEQIGRFSDPYQWLSHFPPIGKAHLKDFGLKVDWRRSFITTEANPYYNKFIEWQFMKLKAQNKIEFGNRPTIFSPAENQPCADHDRASGETVKPQQYTLIKMEVVNDGATPFTKKNGDKLAPLYELGKKIYLVAATLRPETMYGQTNCFVLPRGEYIAIETVDNEIFICSQHAARNMSWQEFTAKEGEYSVLSALEGWDLLGRALKAPHAVYDKVYVLPLTTIKMDKGTGIVTSVPSDAPADYAALRDAKHDKKWRDKYYLTDEMVKPFDVVQIIHIDEFESDQSAVDLVEKYKVKTQNDTTKLDEIKNLVYKYGFAQGVMLVGDFKGDKVSVAKDKCQRQLIQKGFAKVYWEPEDTVISRTNSKCVVAFCDQWFLKYGIQDADNEESKENEWQQAVKKHIIEDLECYNKATKDNFTTVIDWLHSWACSREFGLGTKLPWDKEWVIESLSDSTIYMCYYTIAHYLQNDSMDGDIKTNKINPNDLTPAVFDAIFCKQDVDKIDFNASTLNKELVLKMRQEFEYYYPMDLRVSGKDLIFNHLTMALYNHAAIWPKQSKTKWPQSYFTNGWALLNSEKMSKSTGNFLTIQQCVALYGADATRFALANAGDTLEDANFETDVANAAILGLTRFENFVEETYSTLTAKNANYRDGAMSEMDKLFENAINRTINETEIAYKTMKFRDVLRFGYHILQSNADYYVAHVDDGIHRDLIQKYIDVQLLLISPVCPHITECIWGKIHKLNDFIVNASWPKSGKEDLIKTLQFESLQKVSHDFRNSYNSDEKDRRRKLNKAKKGSDKHAQLSLKVNGANVCVADDYKPYHKKVLALLLEIYDEESNDLRVENWKAYLLKNIGVGNNDNEANDGGKKKKKKKKLSKEQQEQLRFASYLVKDIMPDRKKETFDQTLAYDEFKFLKSNMKLLFHGIDIDLNKVTFYKESDANAPTNIKAKTKVGDPAVKFIYVE